MFENVVNFIVDDPYEYEIDEMMAKAKKEIWWSFLVIQVSSLSH